MLHVWVEGVYSIVWGHLGMWSPLGVQPLINDLDIATLMDPQETLHTLHGLYDTNTVTIAYVCVHFISMGTTIN